MILNEKETQCLHELLHKLVEGLSTTQKETTPEGRKATEDFIALCCTERYAASMLEKFQPKQMTRKEYIHLQGRIKELEKLYNQAAGSAAEQLRISYKLLPLYRQSTTYLEAQNQTVWHGVA